MEQGLPPEVQTEFVVLGACLLDASAINDSLEFLTAGDFYTETHQRIYTCICDLAETGNSVDTITVMNDLQRRGWLDVVGGGAYLSHLVAGVPRNASVAAYVKIVKDKSTLRQLASLCEVGMNRAMDKSEASADILADMEERILELSERQQSQAFFTVTDAIKAAGNIDAYMEVMCDPKEMNGLPIGYTDIDKLWGGLKGNQLTIIAARPSMGKTAWAINIASNVVIEDPDAVVALFSIESSTESIHKRIYAGLAEVSWKRIAEGFTSIAERDRLEAKVYLMAEKHLMIDDTAHLTTLQMRAKCRRLKQKMGRLDLVMVDYLQLMRAAGKHGSRELEVSSISRGLKALSKELDAPVVALAQLSRKNEERGDKRPMLSDLRESGSIEQDADIVAFIHRPEYYASDDDPNVERGVAEIITAKNREGGTGTRKLAYRADITRFSNLMLTGDPYAY